MSLSRDVAFQRMELAADIKKIIVDTMPLADATGFCFGLAMVLGAEAFGSRDNAKKEIEKLIVDFDKNILAARRLIG